MAEIVAYQGGDGPVGVTLPGVIKHGIVQRAANLARSWEGCDAVKLLRSAIGRPVVVLNDADAAGIAETRFGAGRDEKGQVLMITFGTGIGSALFAGATLLSCTEFGYIQVNGRAGELHASMQARKSEGLTWPQWAERAL